MNAWACETVGVCMWGIGGLRDREKNKGGGRVGDREKNKGREE